MIVKVTRTIGIEFDDNVWCIVEIVTSRGDYITSPECFESKQSAIDYIKRTVGV